MATHNGRDDEVEAIKVMTAGPEGAASARDQRSGDGQDDRAIQVVLPMTAESVGLARRRASEALSSWELQHLEETAVLLVSELVSNAVRHASSEAGVELRLTASRRLRIAVSDADPHPPQPRNPEGMDETGFGFVLVKALASDWGVRSSATGKTVWVELDLGPQTLPEPRRGRSPVLIDTGPAVIARRVATGAARTVTRRSGLARRRGR